MEQLVREQPPGFGGVERVAHNLATEWGDRVYSLRSARSDYDPLMVCYSRSRLPSIALGRLLLPIPSLSIVQLLISRKPLLVHLPCPTVLFLLLIARLLNPRRDLRVYWHSCITPRRSFSGYLEAIYQALAYRLVKIFPVTTTSPMLLKTLSRNGFPEHRLTWLACALPVDIEQAYNQICSKRSKVPFQLKGRIIAVGRLDSYKRIDWLIKAFASVLSAKELWLVGDGPDRSKLEALAQSNKRSDQRITFFGRIDEQSKIQLLRDSDVLVLAADRCNEAFGIVQLEAMACATPAIAFDIADSGMHWVSRVRTLSWSGKPKDLALVLERLLQEAPLCQLVAEQSRQRYKSHFAYEVWKRRFQEIFTDNEY